MARRPLVALIGAVLLFAASACQTGDASVDCPDDAPRENDAVMVFIPMTVDKVTFLQPFWIPVSQCQ